MPAIGNEQPSSSNQTGSYATTALHALRLQSDNPAAGTVAAAALPTTTSIASIILSNFLPSDSYALPTVQPPSSQSLVVASSAEDLNNFHDVTFDFFDEDDDLFGSPLAFDASENGLWNGRFVPPPPRPPFFVDEPVLSDGLTTCDLCSWAMPTKSTFIFEGTIEKASELGWPLTLIIVSILSALLGAIIMITVVRCRRKKSSNNRNETHVQWWSRNKRPNNNNHLRRSNIYTAHPADSIRGLHQPTLSASSSLTAMTAMGAAAAAVAAGEATTAAQAMATAGTSQQQQQQQQQQYYHQQQHMQQQFQPQHQQHEYEYEHEYHQPQELQQQHHHQRQHSASISSASATSSPSLTTTITTMMPFQQQQLDSTNWQHSASSMAVAS